MRRMRVVSMLLVVAMLGTTVVPTYTYGEEIGTIMDLTEESTETENTEEVSEEDSEETSEETEAVTEFEEDMATEDTITDANASLEDFTPEEEISETEAAMNQEKVKAFVERMYTKAFGREADAAGVEYWTDTLMKKEKTAAEVGYGFVFSDEYKSKNAKDDSFVEMLYNVFMDRKSDPEGKAYWVSLLQKGYSRRYVYRKFAHSQEFSDICKDYKITRGVITLDSERDRWPELTEYVGRLYDKALDRHPDDDGMNWWCTNIKNHTMTPVAAAESFILSPEFESKNLNNEEYIKVLYRTFMGREYDQDGMNYWLGRINNGESRRTILRCFAGCPEFTAIAARAGISEETVTREDPNGNTVTYRPSDYYLNWSYIADQVTAMLTSSYPLTYVGEDDGSWWECDEFDGYMWLYWNTEASIQDIYNAECNRIKQMGGTENTWGGAIGVKILRIEETHDGERYIYFRVYG